MTQNCQQATQGANTHKDTELLGQNSKRIKQTNRQDQEAVEEGR